jgi:hypothetical protein
VQVLPEREWPVHYKEVQPMNLIDKELQQSIKDDNEGMDAHGLRDHAVDDAEEQARESKQKINLMDRINGESERRVTAKVLGIIKPMNKTYGGSILKM